MSGVASLSVHYKPHLDSEHNLQDMDQSYITRQRRFALIPKGAILSPEDEQAVRMRTGDVIPATSSRDAITEFSFTTQLCASISIRSEHSHGMKRKASMTAEEYQAAVTEQQESTIKSQDGNGKWKQVGKFGLGNSEMKDLKLEGEQDIFADVVDLYGPEMKAKDCRTSSLCEASPKAVAATVWTS